MAHAMSLMAVVLAVSALQPSDPPPPSAEQLREAARAKTSAFVRAWDEKNRSDFGSHADRLVRPGLMADRKRKQVTLKATATGLEGTGPVEFFLIGPGSSKGYEAVAVSFAVPSDVVAGLEFIGLKAGRPVDYGRMRFWPKGERVRMTFQWEEPGPDGTVSRRSARAEEMLALRSGHAMPLTGLTFVGGQWLPPDKEGGPKRFYGDLGDPGSIASNYNDATTVLDLPVQARQGEVYQSRIINPANRLAPGQLLEITLEPDSPGMTRVTDVTLTVAGGKELAGLKFTARAGTQLLADAATPAAFVEAMTKLVADKEPFVTVEPTAELPLTAVRQLYVFLQALQGEQGLRLEPPSAGHLFHEAFTPDEAMRDFRKRFWQPHEVRLSPDGNILLRDFEERPGTANAPTPKDNPVGGAMELKKMLADRADQRRPIAVYAPGTLTYGELMKVLAPALPEGSVVWVFLE